MGERMKRSEMLEYLVQVLKLPRTNMVSEEVLAEEILTALEANGMVPPEIETEFYDRANCDYHKAHEWEKE